MHHHQHAPIYFSIYVKILGRILMFRNPPEIPFLFHNHAPSPAFMAAISAALAYSTRRHQNPLLDCSSLASAL